VLQRIAWLALVLALSTAGCSDAGKAPAPSFRLLFPPLTGELQTSSSPAITDLTGDNVPDIVFGTGVDRIAPGQERYGLRPDPEISGYVVAVSGATNEILWSVPNPRDAFTTPRFLEVNRDGVPDVIMGGREGFLTAFSGRNGVVLWRTTGAEVATTPIPYNFFTPALIRDANGDGISDLATPYGGDDTRPPHTPRSTGYVTVISGADGKVLSVHETPDRAETYSSGVVYPRADGTEWLVFGTGGETHGGAAWRAPVTSLLDGTFAQRVERLTEPGSKGVIAPAVIVELTGDDEPDIVISTFDGRLIAINGANGAMLWEQGKEGEETYHPPAVLRRSRNGTLALFLSRGIGVFPRYTGSIHRLIDAANGHVLVEYDNAFAPGGAPLAVDLTGDGVDEPVFFSVRFPGAQSSRIHILHLATSKLATFDLPTVFGTTPVIADVRGSGALEMIGLAWQVHRDSAATADTSRVTWRDMRWQLIRLDLAAAPPEFMSWAAYMGTATDGRFRSPRMRTTSREQGRAR
jgi:outer membrane protein assembly factor BamB